MHQSVISKFAATARKLAAELNPRPGSEFFRRLLYRVRSRYQQPPTIVMVDRPRDLDDLYTDPDAQARVGEAIAKQANKPRK
jgi:hypothetical protein